MIEAAFPTRDQSSLIYEVKKPKKKSKAKDDWGPWGRVIEEPEETPPKPTAFQSLTFATRPFPNSYPSLTWAAKNPRGPCNESPVLLGHAKLYVFAVKRVVPQLRDLALYKIHAILKQHKPAGDNLLAVLDLVTFAFHEDHTPEEVDGKKEPLRDMLVNYVVDRIHIIQSSGLFADLLAQGGPFVTWFWSALQQSVVFKAVE